ncbi:porin family protein [Sphingobacterium pedocola]|uniref:PorT family protein n=1 Tax=Sphingobacterium pedocola TaxID=2082722 RepID=A0ABR9TA69_9SPHI|nr:porin family protein [Sphingobacterium pedocola]MBE8722267.1 PorT family protein [Sphingobacterium pedocola]
MRQPAVILIASLAFLATTFATPSAKGQDYYRNRSSNGDKNIRLALTFNPNIGWLKYDNDFKANAKPGYSYGLVADFGFTRNYYFSTGLLINAINSDVDAHNAVDADDPLLYYSRNIHLKYAEVPLTIKLKSEENHLGRFYGQFGFTAGVKVSGREQLHNQTTKTSIDGDDIFRLGLQIGGGAEWRLSNSLALLTGIAYNNGFTRAINDIGKPKTSYVSLNVGLFF